jgi:uncharacterized protein YbbC (DUF1343 family)
MSPNPKYKDQEISGVIVNVTDRTSFSPYLCGISLVKYIYDANRDKFEWRENHFDRLCGTDRIRKAIISGKPLDSVSDWLESDRQKFMKIRDKYLLY